MLTDGGVWILISATACCGVAALSVTTVDMAVRRRIWASRPGGRHSRRFARWRHTSGLVVGAPYRWRRRHRAVAVLAVSAGMAIATHSVVPVLGGVVVGGLAEQWHRAARSRRQRAFDTALPEYIDALVRALRSGRSLREAIDIASDGQPAVVIADITEVRRELAAGVPMRTALSAWAERSASPHVPPLCAVLRLGDRLGGSLAAALDGCARTVRDQLEVRDEVRALTSQARASAWAVAVLPLGASVMLASLDPGVADFLLHSWAGAACVVVALLLDGIAVMWMSAAIASAT